ncbi:membrane-bound lytic murein transglycosylase [Candidatus Scalindua japonica]|uniref:peptidoglycan lytic exotransglycosylase n=1 Tax=Candidatus Scalindua japonica TaxID=1284222 RepID=A0A286U1T9_9BACT|nr:membrane-bound lytic murein transglycosylase [Candidatus Scalindua japonica]
MKRPLLLPAKAGLGLSEILNPNQFPDFRDDYDKELLLQCISNSIEYFKKIKYYPDSFSSIGFTPENQIETLEFFRDGYNRYNNSQELNEFVSNNFRVFQAVGKSYKGQVHFTGYGTPIYDGSLTPTDTFRYPLYGKPADFRKPYFTRSEIEERDLLRGTEIAYLKTKLEAYLIHVQGSGQIRLASGEKVYVGYAGNSGHSYTSIGQLLVNDGKVRAEELTLPVLIEYFDRHPDELDYYLKQNDRYIFFKKVPHAVPHGSIGVPVTPMRSIATDKKVFPPGGLAFVAIGTERPGGAGRSGDKWHVEKSFFVLDQDTGSAIKTSARADVFFGIGDDAMYKAGNLNTYGKLYYLLKK